MKAARSVPNKRKLASQEKRPVPKKRKPAFQEEPRRQFQRKATGHQYRARVNVQLSLEHPPAPNDERPKSRKRTLDAFALPKKQAKAVDNVYPRGKRPRRFTSARPDSREEFHQKPRRRDKHVTQPDPPTDPSVFLAPNPAFTPSTAEFYSPPKVFATPFDPPPPYPLDALDPLDLPPPYPYHLDPEYCAESPVNSVNVINAVNSVNSVNSVNAVDSAVDFNPPASPPETPEKHIASLLARLMELCKPAAKESAVGESAQPTRPLGLTVGESAQSTRLLGLIVIPLFLVQSPQGTCFAAMLSSLDVEMMEDYKKMRVYCAIELFPDILVYTDEGALNSPSLLFRKVIQEIARDFPQVVPSSISLYSSKEDLLTINCSLVPPFFTPLHDTIPHNVSVVYWKAALQHVPFHFQSLWLPNVVSALTYSAQANGTTAVAPPPPPAELPQGDQVNRDLVNPPVLALAPPQPASQGSALMLYSGGNNQNASDSSASDLDHHLVFIHCIIMPCHEDTFNQKFSLFFPLQVLRRCPMVLLSSLCCKVGTLMSQHRKQQQATPRARFLSTQSDAIEENAKISILDRIKSFVKRILQHHATQPITNGAVILLPFPFYFVRKSRQMTQPKVIHCPTHPDSSAPSFEVKVVRWEEEKRDLMLDCQPGGLSWCCMLKYTVEQARALIAQKLNQVEAKKLKMRNLKCHPYNILLTQRSDTKLLTIPGSTYFDFDTKTVECCFDSLGWEGKCSLCCKLLTNSNAIRKERFAGSSRNQPEAAATIGNQPQAKVDQSPRILVEKQSTGDVGKEIKKDCLFRYDEQVGKKKQTRKCPHAVHVGCMEISMHDVSKGIVHIADQCLECMVDLFIVK